MFFSGNVHFLNGKSHLTRYDHFQGETVTFNGDFLAIGGGSPPDGGPQGQEHRQKPNNGAAEMSTEESPRNEENSEAFISHTDGDHHNEESERPPRPALNEEPPNGMNQIGETPEHSQPHDHHPPLEQGQPLGEELSVHQGHQHNQGRPQDQGQHIAAALNSEEMQRENEDESFVTTVEYLRPSSNEFSISDLNPVEHISGRLVQFSTLAYENELYIFGTFCSLKIFYL